MPLRTGGRCRTNGIYLLTNYVLTDKFCMELMLVLCTKRSRTNGIPPVLVLCLLDRTVRSLSDLDVLCVFLSLFLFLLSSSGRCRRRIAGADCDIGRRQRTIHILSGSVLSVWSTLERTLQYKASSSQQKLRIMRVKTDDGNTIIGKTCLSLLRLLTLLH